MSIMPNGFSDYGFGTYNSSGNSFWGSFKSVASDLIQYISPTPGAPQMGSMSMVIKANFGENPLSKAGIAAGKEFSKILQKQ